MKVSLFVMIQFRVMEFITLIQQ